MSRCNAIDLFFGGMEKLGPGSKSDTLKVLGIVAPENSLRTVSPSILNADGIFSKDKWLGTNVPTL